MEQIKREELRNKETARADALQGQVEKLKLALSLNCELHGCDSELCTAEEYHRDADKLLAERAALRKQVDRLTILIKEYRLSIVQHYLCEPHRCCAICVQVDLLIAELENYKE